MVTAILVFLILLFLVASFATWMLYRLVMGSKLIQQQMFMIGDLTYLTCHYCGERFPLADTEQIGKYTYCREHAHRIH
jgi:hypothetical protein